MELRDQLSALVKAQSLLRDKAKAGDRNVSQMPTPAPAEDATQTTPHS